jgi:hypothetical protein
MAVHPKPRRPAFGRRRTHVLRKPKPARRQKQACLARFCDMREKRGADRLGDGFRRMSAFAEVEALFEIKP